MKKILLSFWVLMVLIALFTVFCATTGTAGDLSQTSNKVNYPGLPSDIKLLRDTEVIPPDPSVPKEWTPFPGAWYGIFRSLHDSQKNNHALVVEWVNKFGMCQVVYSWGARAVGWTGDVRRYACAIKDGELIIDWGNGMSATYRLHGKDTLLGRWDDKGDTFTATMSRFRFDPEKLGK